MQLALLGSGNEFIQLTRGLVTGGHIITHIGPVNMSNQKDQQRFADELGANLVLDHTELVNYGISDIVMCSYAPLIEMNDLKRARFYNIHYALLPRFRGMHGLVWGIINDEKEVGYTLHLVDDGIDSGPIYHQGKILVKEDDDVITLRNKIDQLLYTEIGTVFQRIENGELKAVEQRHSQATYGTRRTIADSEINWKWPARRIFNLIRALTPPHTAGAFTYYKNEELIITKAHCLENPSYFMTPGKIVGFEDNSVYVKCGDTIVSIDEIIYQGNKYLARNVLNKTGLRLG